MSLFILTTISPVVEEHLEDPDHQPDAITAVFDDRLLSDPKLPHFEDKAKVSFAFMVCCNTF